MKNATSSYLNPSASNEIKTVHVYSYPVMIEGETYLYSIVIDQTAFAASQSLNQIFTFTIIVLVSLFFLVTLILLIRIIGKKNQLEASERIITAQNTTMETLISNLPGVAYRSLYDDSWTMTYLSDQITELTGYPKESFYSNVITFNDLIVKDDQAYVRNTFNEALELTKAVSLSYRIRDKANKIKWVYESAKILDNATIEGFIQDITDKKEAELKALAYQYQLQDIVTHSNQGIAIHDANLNYLYVSEAYIRMYRVNREDIIGRHHYEVFPDLPEKWKDVHQKALKGETSSSDRDVYVRQDGSVDYTRWLCRPWYTDNNEIGGIVIYSEVINSIIKTELELEKTNERLLLVMDNLPIGIAVNSVLPEVKFSYMNENFPHFYGTSKEKLTESGDFFGIVYEDEHFRETLKAQVLTDIASNDIARMKWEGVPIKQNGEVIKYINAYAVPIPNSDLLISTVVDVTEQKRKEEAILYTANHDYLTGLPNRGYFDSCLSSYDTEEHLPISFLMLDVDGLKLINDAYVHETGNHALITLSDRLKNLRREKDVIARMGGDEFVFLCPNTTVNEASDLKQAIYEAISDLEIEDLKITLSVGVGTKSSRSKTIEDALNDAENAMYASKILYGKSGRNDAVMSVFETLKEKYDEERIHSDNVSVYCKKMGEALNLREDEVKELELAGLMHDVGKITIPDSILDKPGKLTSDEWKIMKNHTVNGYQILRSADKYSRLAEYALSHHERMDGKGYPNGLVGEDIPLFSRIICICDAFEAMTADRPYRKAQTLEYAISELNRGSGTQFDPNLVKLFIRVVI